MIYFISNLTVRLYDSNHIEIIRNDNLIEFQQYLIDIENGAEIIYLDSLDFEIEELNKPEVPQQLSRMKFIIQVFITTGIKYEDIVLFIQNLTFDEAQKYVILTRLRSATHFDRNSGDLLTIAQMMGITSEQLDNIFINGNLIE